MPTAASEYNGSLFALGEKICGIAGTGGGPE
jgi:hypothetical protein